MGVLVTPSTSLGYRKKDVGGRNKSERPADYSCYPSRVSPAEPINAVMAVLVTAIHVFLCVVKL
jgi:hypothetical protein